MGDLARRLDRPVAFCPFAPAKAVEPLKHETGYPVFTRIEPAIRALAASRDWHMRHPRLQPLPARPRQRPQEVEELLGREGVLTADAALALCAAFDVPIAEWAAVQDIDAALVAAGTIGYPVVLKVLSRDISHKSDMGGVMLGIRGPEALREAFDTLLGRMEARAPEAIISGMLVQQQLVGGREVILGGKRDPSFGPVMMFGLGGVYVEVFADVAFRLAPLTREMAKEMMSEVRANRLLWGVRGEQPVDVGAVVEALLALSRLLVDCPEVQEVDINPLLVFDRGAAAVDARVVVTREELD
jgi:acetyltransferase